MNLADFLLGPTFGKVLDKIFPDPAAKTQAQLQLLQLQQAGEFKEIDAELQQTQGQVEIDKQEAASQSLFVAGWRPAIGWICGLGLCVQFLVGPLFTWVAAIIGHPVTFPSLDMGTLLTLLFGMLGLGGMRTMEKLKGVSAGH
jgi:hypothetical protein